jgi:hypothetical protein
MFTSRDLGPLLQAAGSRVRVPVRPLPAATYVILPAALCLESS